MPVLPVVGWSTVGGDLRAPHFVGLHALQVVPFVGWLASRRKRWPVARRLALVWTASGSYLGVMALLAWQALRGQPLLRPDALTLGAFAGLVTLSAVATGLIFRLSRPQTVDRARRYVKICLRARGARGCFWAGLVVYLAGDRQVAC